ncbi:MAG TPA: ArsA family ATPase, partial [Pseudonocardiaceae bacterium]
MRLLLFTGKGGVGKTTLAAATGTRLAAAGRKVLVVSTDPAHSLADALDTPLGADPAEVPGCEGLYAAQVDALRLLDGAWAQLRTHLGALLAGAGVDEVAAEELTVLPGVEELLALTEVVELARHGPWEVVLVDCAPTAETLRLLALPDALAGYLEKLFPAHRRVLRGVLPRAGAGWAAAAEALSRLAERLQTLRAALTDPAVTGVRLVLTPERVVLAEVRRTLTALALLGIAVDGVLANRLVPAVAPSARGAAAGWMRARRAEQDEVLAALA